MGTAFAVDPSYRVTYAADFDPTRSRLTTFFRLLLLLPVAVVAIVYALLGIVTVPLAWLAVVVTGRYPAALYAFNAGLVRHFTRINAYASLITDRYPPFGPGAADDYPVRIHIGERQATYSRAKAFFRLLLAIPPYLVAYVLQVVGQVAAIGSWFFILVTGRQLPALQAVQNMNFAWGTRTYAYLLLLTEDWPPFGEIQPQVAPGGTAQGEIPAGFSA